MPVYYPGDHKNSDQKVEDQAPLIRTSSDESSHLAIKRHHSEFPVSTQLLNSLNTFDARLPIKN